MYVTPTLVIGLIHIGITHMIEVLTSLLQFGFDVYTDRQTDR